jgi:HAD superfamily hydrolase (TIGR01509 family)
MSETADQTGYDLTAYDAILFDLDGVITPTADLHRAAWSEMFTDFFATWSERTGRDVAPYTEQDYFDHLDGRNRFEGVRSLLDSRGIDLPEDRAAAGEQGQDAPTDDTVTGLGLRKNAEFLHLLEQGMDPYPGAVALLDALEPTPVQVAIVSSSRNARQVLTAAGLIDRFGLIVDGEVAAEHGLPGKPRPDTYAYGAAALGVPRDRAVVVEDATSGVAAGRAGDFGLVVGVDRGAGRRALLDAGADVVVDDPGDFVGTF